jgi:hypothetical protein
VSGADARTDHSFEIALLENVLKRDEQDTVVVETLANLYTEAGLFKKGLDLDRRNVELAPKNATAHYNLACSLSLTGAIDEAFAELEVAMDLGFDDIDWMKKDPDLYALKSDPRWRKFA